MLSAPVGTDLKGPLLAAFEQHNADADALELRVDREHREVRRAGLEEARRERHLLVLVEQDDADDRLCARVIRNGEVGLAREHTVKGCRFVLPPGERVEPERALTGVRPVQKPGDLGDRVARHEPANGDVLLADVRDADTVVVEMAGLVVHSQQG